MYIFYFALVMLAPAAMVIVGLMWKISPPPYQAKGLAYSTELTRKDPEAWTAAHRHCVRLWTRTGLVSGGASALLMVHFLDVAHRGSDGAVLCVGVDDRSVAEKYVF